MASHFSSKRRLDASDAQNTRKITQLYADRSAQKWVVLDSEGQFWELPFVENPWEQRQPYELTDDAELEPVPGHYKYLIGLPW